MTPAGVRLHYQRVVTEPPAHGTRRRYQLGCRCHDCTEDNNRYMRAYRAGACGTRAAPVVEPVVVVTWRPRTVAEIARAREW
jgi:hypothetical protein